LDRAENPMHASWPGNSAKRVFALFAPATHVFPAAAPKNVDARRKAGHHELQR